MAVNYSLKYKRFDQLLDEVMVDFKSYSLENLIEPQELIKVAKKVSYDLGLRIYQTKEDVLEVSHGKVKLPYDFYIFNFGLLCTEFTVNTSSPGGTHIEEIPYTPYREIPATVSICDPGTVCTKCNLIPADGMCGCTKTCVGPPVPDYNPLVPYGDYCVKPRVFMNCKGQSYELVQIVKNETRTFKEMLPLRLVDYGPEVECGCPNINYRCAHEIRIKDGWLYTNFQTGRVYLNYQGMLEDADGNLMVADQEFLNEYYEYALKERILENLWFNGEDVERRLMYAQSKLKVAKVTAKNFVTTPNFSEIRDVWANNRKVQMNKYFSLFAPVTDLPYGGVNPLWPNRVY